MPTLKEQVKQLTEELEEERERSVQQQQYVADLVDKYEQEVQRANEAEYRERRAWRQLDDMREYAMNLVQRIRFLEGGN